MLVVKELIGQVMKLHAGRGITHLHIGCDEVFHLGECDSCRTHGRSEIFVSHVAAVAKHVKEAYNVQPIIWDDMLRNFMAAELQPLANGLVEPMVWVYAEDVYRFVPSYTFDTFSEVFDTLWTASAFKGAHGPTLTAPNVKRHLDNNINWLDLMGAEEAKFKNGFRGIVLTGWQVI